MVQIKTINYMEKVQYKKEPSCEESGKSVCCNEEVVYTIAVRSEHLLLDCSIAVESDLDGMVDVFHLERVPCATPWREGADDYIIDGDLLLPDLLRPLGKMDVTLKYGQWNTYCVTVNQKGEKMPVGEHSVAVIFRDANGEELGRSVYVVNVLPVELPKATLPYTNWVHYDCLSDWYGEKPFTERFYQILEKYIENAVLHGMNMVYTPLFTPPLDTQIGGERPTAQLIGVYERDGAYSFDFSKLREFVEKMRAWGIAYFEFSHLFTQWGAECCPKIEVCTSQGVEKRFGWAVDSQSAEYTAFLRAFLPALNDFVKENGLVGKCYYHISDEPRLEHIERYAKLYEFVSALLPDVRGMDAMSEYSFYERGIVDTVVVATSAADKFIENKVENYWAYHCVTQNGSYLSNRFIAMPGERTRVIGLQLYLTGVKGFLHWGYNFYYSYLSKFKINPYECTDAAGVCTSGDPFIVYPTKDGLLNSLRIKYIRAAFADYAALELLEKKIGREKVEEFLTEKGLSKNFTDYPHGVEWLEGLRQKINEELMRL